jgi:hypothetical protein
MTATWPGIQLPTFGSENIVSKPALRSKSEAGYTMTRSRMTLAKERRVLRWNYISNTDFATLKTFFETNSGGSFSWTDPMTSETKEYTFSDDELKFDEAGPGYKSGTVNIEEI